MTKRRMRFKKWCSKNPTDDREIYYKVRRDGKVYEFTSLYNDTPITIHWLSEHAMIDHIELVNDSLWYVELSGRK